MAYIPRFIVGFYALDSIDAAGRVRDKSSSEAGTCKARVRSTYHTCSLEDSDLSCDTRATSRHRKVLFVFESGLIRTCVYLIDLRRHIERDQSEFVKRQFIMR
ncbi:hypothetical protein IAQ61_010221 [Plenodomus lingam]|uniref:uncharacterized protein n=1 Tax=Leptosphaeria maculans TaxID=5022 RepID=UPI003328B28E|nr:hypothetical protein IAQ61_010221 [Plenodomus lingam]